jgi:hypothetical protein
MLTKIQEVFKKAVKLAVKTYYFLFLRIVILFELSTVSILHL